MPRRIALIIGISHYQRQTKLTPLQAPVHDAQAVYEILAEYGDFDTLHPLPLADGKVGESGSVSVAELQEVLQQVFSPHSDDEIELVALYFSGHGVFDSRGQVVYLSASDEAQAIALSWLADLAKNSAAQNVCLWLDCCHSGELLKFSDLGDKGFCVVAASHAEGEALAKEGRSLLTEILCQALTPDTEQRREIRVLDFVQAIKTGRKNLPQQVLYRYSDSAFTLTQWQSEITVASKYPPDHPPYKGLLAFRQADEAFFFGRERMVQQLLNRLHGQCFVPVLGASGSGKSSLVLAGLLPRLAAEDWQVLLMRPSAHPLQSLRDTLVKAFPEQSIATLNSADDLHTAVQHVSPAGKRLLLVIDQFEEAFTECQAEHERADFFAMVLGAVQQANALHVVITLRTDFLGAATAQVYSGLGEYLQQDVALLLVALSPAELREAISKPLGLVGMRCEAVLEDELVAQTMQEQGSLPLLQYVLDKLWQSARQAHSRELTLELYQQLGGQHGGGLRGVLNEKADAFYQQLDTEQQRLMEWLLVELSQVGDSHQSDMRRTVPLQELHNRQPNHSTALDALLDKLVTQERLLTQDKDEDGQATVTVAHEALLRDWEKLSTWLTRDREIKQWRERQADNIAAWKTGVSGSLLREKRLAEAQQLLEDYPDSLLIGADEREFVKTSEKAFNDEKERDRQKTLLANFHLARTYVEKIKVLLKKVEQQENCANSLRHALLYTLEAQRYPVLEDKEVIDSKILGYLGKVNANWLLAERVKTPALNMRAKATYVAFSPDGKKIAVILDEKIIELWCLQSKKRLHTFQVNSQLNVVVFSPDGKQIAGAAGEKKTPQLTLTGWKPHGRLWLWDVESAETIHELNVEAGDVTCLAFSPDGANIYSAVRDVNGKSIIIQMWNTKTRECIETNKCNTANPRSIALSLDGKLLASTSLENRSALPKESTSEQSLSWLEQLEQTVYSHTVQLWSTETGQLVRSLKDYSNAVTCLTFNADNSQLAIGSENSTIRLWDIQTRLPLNDLEGHCDTASCIAFSPDGKKIASGSESATSNANLENDYSVRVWDSKTGKLLKTLIRHSSVVNSLAFSPDSVYVASALGLSSEGMYLSDHTVQVWDTNTGKPYQPTISHTNSVNSVAFSPDGQLVASASTDKTVFLWSAKNLNVCKILRGHSHSVNSVAFSPNGKLVASASDDNTIRIWDIITDNTPKTLEDSSSGVNAIVFSPDGMKLAGACQDNKVRIWEIETEILLATLTGHSNNVTSIAFSPDGKQLASGSDDAKVLLWDIKTNKEIDLLTAPLNKAIKSIIFSPDGEQFASLAENSVRLWDTKRWEPLEVFLCHPIEANAITFSHDGFFAASGANTIKLWDTRTGQVINTIVGDLETVSSIAFSSDGKKIVSGSKDHTVRLWDAWSGRVFNTLTTGSSEYFRFNCLAFSPDGKKLATGVSNDSTIKLWGTETGVLSHELEGDFHAAQCLAFSSDGSMLAIASFSSRPTYNEPDAAISLYDIKTEEVTKVLPGHANTIVFSPNDKLLASISGETVSLWDVENEGKIHTLTHTENKTVSDRKFHQQMRPLSTETSTQHLTLSVKAIVFGKDDKQIITATQNKIFFWELDTNSKPKELTFKEFNLNYDNFIFSPDGKLLICTTYHESGKSFVLIHDVKTGKKIKAFEDISGKIIDLSVSSDSKKLAIVLNNHNVLIWDLQIYKLQNKYLSPVKTINFSPDNEQIASISFDNNDVRLMRLKNGSNPDPVIDLLHVFDSGEVADALKFLWNLELDNESLEFVPNAPEPALFPQEGDHYITWNDHTRKFIPLLEAPREDETKMDQLIRWLEERCAYKREEDKQACEAERQTNNPQAAAE